MRNLQRLSQAFVLAISLTASAHAGQVLHQTVIHSVPIGGSASTTLPAFDPNLGVLRLARVSIFCDVSGTIGFENTSGAPVGVGGYAGGTFVGAYVPWSVIGVFGQSPNPAFIPPNVVLASYDGATDYAGASGVTHAFAHESSDGSPAHHIDFYNDTNLAAFAVAGPIAIDVGPMVPQSPYLPPGIVATSTVFVDAYLSIQYDYDSLPTSICHATSLSGCPCNNSSQLGHGCGNSANSTGGALTSWGVASISNDTLTLAASGMTNSNSLFFQGTGLAYAQIPYGDGLRCVTGSLRRLGTRVNQGGAATVPGLGGTPISVFGQVTQPGTRTYQVFYRDAQNYCTPANYNVTSGLAIAWSL